MCMCMHVELESMYCQLLRGWEGAGGTGGREGLGGGMICVRVQFTAHLCS